jgi:hypothetical protein
MLKISTKALGDDVTLVLEGSLSGPWVAEVASVWHRTSIGRKSRRVRVDLSGVTFVSDEGRQLLEQICISGVEIVSSDLLTKAIADELSHKHREARKRWELKCQRDNITKF